MYTIGQVSQMCGIPVSTLRYYDKEGLFPHMERVSGIRRFSDRELETLRIIDCLKKSGLEIREIRKFMQWCAEGSSSYPQRRELFENQKKTVEKEIERLQKTLDMLRLQTEGVLFCAILFCSEIFYVAFNVAVDFFKNFLHPVNS